MTLNRKIPSVELGTPRLKRLLHFFGFNTGRDANMPTAHEYGLAFCDHGYDSLSKSMWECRGIAEDVETKVLGPIMAGADYIETFRGADKLLGLDRCKTGEALRVWSGCMSAAKCIALGTRNGRNWPWWRRRQARRLGELCQRDTQFARGVLAAVAFKVGRNEAWSFFGVPRDSLIRVGWLAINGRRE
jgi:hypothetical protein